MDQRGGGAHENEFWVFSNSEMNVTKVSAEKVDRKNGVTCLVSVMALKFSKKVHFLQFCADLSNKSKYIKAIYIYASERAQCALSENGIVYYAMIDCFRDIKV